MTQPKKAHNLENNRSQRSVTPSYHAVPNSMNNGSGSHLNFTARVRVTYVNMNWGFVQCEVRFPTRRVPPRASYVFSDHTHDSISIYGQINEIKENIINLVNKEVCHA